MSQQWPSFEELRKLAQESPEALELFRAQQVAALIARAPEPCRRRLRGLQFQVDCQRRLHPSPMGSCLAISRMMHESLAQLQAALRGIPGTQSNATGGRDNVVPFTASLR